MADRRHRRLGVSSAAETGHYGWMTETGGLPDVSAACADCGQPVVFEQFGPHSFMAVCSNDPDHPIGADAQSVLDQIRRDHRAP
jgi:hypothetical protein